MDIQVAAASYSLATGKAANIRVYWAPNEPGAIAKAVRQATQDGCDTCSISWGADEGIWKSWTTSDVDYVDDMEDAASEAVKAGMTVFAASGDNDFSDGGSNPANVDVPSSCPSVVGCGGTTKTRSSETVWNDDPGQSNGEGTGGGYSDYFPPPMWQSRAPQIGQVPARRMVPDVAANARSQHRLQHLCPRRVQQLRWNQCCRTTLCGPFCCSRAKACAACCTNSMGAFRVLHRHHDRRKRPVSSGDWPRSLHRPWSADCIKAYSSIRPIDGS